MMKRLFNLMAIVCFCGVVFFPAYGQSTLEILFTYGSEKEDWINATTTQFNLKRIPIKSGKIIRVNPVPMGSGECIDGLISGQTKAHIVSPASGIFIKLANATSRTTSGKDLLPDVENLVLSPVVIAMWKPMAEAMGWGKKAIGWQDILTLSQNQAGWASLEMPQWGQFKLGHTHPEFSNSGLLSIIAEVYAAANKTSHLELADLQKPEVAEFLGAIEKSVVHYGASTGFFGKKMFNNGPSYLSAAVLYENMVIESYANKYRLPFPLVAIYPKEGTFWSDHPAGVVDANWVTQEHREAAKIYIRYLLAPAQQKRALEFGFRPGLVDIPLDSPFDASHGVNPKEPSTTLEVPQAEVVNAIMELWRKNKKHSNVVLVMDTSGSMKEENRMENARRGALQMLSKLDNADSFALLPFSSAFRWAMQLTPLSTGRDQANKTVNSLWAEGGTALYDSINTAHQYLSLQAHPGKITAIVVLTDGQDTASKIQLPALMKQIQFDSEKNNVRIFTIGYGQGANMKVLQAISDATQAKSYAGTHSNIETVFKDISTFF